MRIIILSLMILTIITSFSLGYVIALDVKAQPIKEEAKGAAKEKISPNDHIKEDQIHVYKDRIIIDIDNPRWARFTDTNSMDPVFDSESNAIEVIPSSPADIHTGDIVSYHSNYADGVIVHRVIATGVDEYGWYAIFKGDNNPDVDPGRVRFDQIQRVVVAVIY